MKKKDFMIVGIIALAAFLFLGVFYGINKTKPDLIVRVNQKGETIRTLPLNRNYQERIELESGYNTIVIKNNTAFIESADCGNQVCVHSPAINRLGEIIACLPHQLTLEIVQNKQ